MKESLIRDYNSIRPILRHIYIFGFYTKEDYEKLDIKMRTYETYEKRINTFLPEDFILKKRVNRKVIQYCQYDMYKDTQNYIINTFRTKTFVKRDLKVFFYLLQLLNSEEFDEITLNEFCNMVPNDINNELTIKNISNSIKELQKYGYIEPGVSNKRTYKLKEDILKELTAEEIEDICILLEIIRNQVSIEVPFFLLQKKLELYLYSEYEQKEAMKDFFLNKHGHLFNILDDDIIFTALKAIEKRSYVNLSMKNKFGEKVFSLIPIKIIHDIFYGRQYLLGYSDLFENFTITRLDRIDKIEIGKEIDDLKYEKILGDSKEEELCWCTANISNKENILVKIEFSFDEKTEGFILERIKKEGANGTVKKLESGKYLYEIYTKDPKEMIPWIRSFGERAKVIESGESKIEEQILSDWKELLDKYGVI